VESHPHFSNRQKPAKVQSRANCPSNRSRVFHAVQEPCQQRVESGRLVSTRKSGAVLDESRTRRSSRPCQRVSPRHQSLSCQLLEEATATPVAFFLSKAGSPRPHRPAATRPTWAGVALDADPDTGEHASSPYSVFLIWHGSEGQASPGWMTLPKTNTGTGPNQRGKSETLGDNRNRFAVDKGSHASPPRNYPRGEVCRLIPFRFACPQVGQPAQTHQLKKSPPLPLPPFQQLKGRGTLLPPPLA
jgi:hypothetical protein